MTRKEFIEAFMAEANLTSYKEAERYYTALLALLRRLIVEGIDITLPTIGRIMVYRRAERKGRNPKTGKEMTIRACRIAKLITSPSMRKSLNT